MTPADFIAKWKTSTLGERQGAHSHFLDLCDLLGEPKPLDNDSYCFEKGASKTGGGDGWADVWRKGCFGWEYKGKHKDLNAALRQLQAYALDLQNPPYLVVCDMERIIVHTNWTNTVSRRIELTLDDLHEPEKLNLLRAVFEGSESLRPKVSPQELTAKVAQRFGALGRRLQERKDAAGQPMHHPRDIAHFLNRLVFCMFAEDAELLPKGLFTRFCRSAERRPPQETATHFDNLFAAMRLGGLFGVDHIRRFNGGLFDAAPALALERADLKLIGDTAGEHDWSEIDPAIFGNLFEEALKATRERPALGAHYTDRAKILKIIDPVIVRPLTAKWEAALTEVRAAMDARADAEGERRSILDKAAEAMKIDPDAARAGEGARRKALAAVEKRRAAALGAAAAQLETFLAELAAFRVLDPACGSGNILYVALHALKDLERRALVDAERMGVPVPAPRVGLECVRGIEIDAYAAELARVTLWIGDLQWNARNNYTGLAEPILSNLDQIENRDALLNPDGSEAQWPAADVIVGNPPFVGGKRLRTSLGDPYVERLFATYKGRVPAEADFVVYWVEKAWGVVSAAIAETSANSAHPREGVGPDGPGVAPSNSALEVETWVPASAGMSGKRAGLVTTNSIRGGANRKVLDRIADADALMEAWADEPWAQEGAAVRVSMLGFGEGFAERRSEGQIVASINADLTTANFDLTKSSKLKESRNICFEGVKKYGAFELTGQQARIWLRSPVNVNGKYNADVIRPLLNGRDLDQRSSDTWVVDFFGVQEDQASLYEVPFGKVLLEVKPTRDVDRSVSTRNNWWVFERNRTQLRQLIAENGRFIAKPVVAKHMFFVWLEKTVLISNLAVAIARDDDTTFGVLHSRIHELWSLRMGTWLGVGNDPRYTPSTTFETFPFPEGLTPNIPAADYADDPRAIAIAAAAKDLNDKREAWLNPPDLVRIEPEVVPGYPDRILPRDEEAAKVLKTRTLTNLYNQRPTWLDNAHRTLDAVVAAAYGWTDWGNGDLPDDEVLARLFALNQERAAAGR